MRSERMPMPSASRAPAEARLPAAEAPPAARTGKVAVMTLVNFRRGSRAWAWLRLVRGPRALAAERGLVFAKVLGCGANGGFGVKPSGTHQGLFTVFADAASADAFLASERIARYRDHADALFTVKLAPISARGSWAGVQPLAVGAEPARPAGPVAALTRASIKPARALRFWRDAPAAERSLAAAPGCLVAAGLGEAPLLRQATFSIWESVAAMNAYARSGAHQEAIEHARAGRFFSEDLFARFVPYQARGTWQGRSFVSGDPLPDTPVPGSGPR